MNTAWVDHVGIPCTASPAALVRQWLCWTSTFRTTIAAPRSPAKAVTPRLGGLEIELDLAQLAAVLPYLCLPGRPYAGPPRWVEEVLDPVVVDGNQAWALGRTRAC